MIPIRTAQFQNPNVYKHINGSRWNANRCYSLRTTYLIFETFQILFPPASSIFIAVKVFIKWYIRKNEQSGRTPVLEEAMTSLFYCFARKSQKINPRKIWLSEKLDSRFHRSISENIKASLSNVPWARVGNFWQSESIKSWSFWKGLRRSRRHFDRHRM